MKKFVAGFMTCALLMAGSVVYGETVTKNIEAVFGKVKLVVNGNNVDKETLVYNGTTYVPLRAAAEILNMEVTWDEATSTAGLYDKGTAPKVEAATIAPEPIPSSEVMFRNSGEVEDYIKNTYTGFSYTTTRADGLDIEKNDLNINIKDVNVMWSSPNKISSIRIWCNDTLLNLITDDLGYETAKGYMKKIADDLIVKLPGVEISSASFVYGWYTYPSIKVDYNARSYCQWKTFNGTFKWEPSLDDKLR